MKRTAALALCLLMLLWAAAALSDAWTGTVGAAETVLITAPAQGVLEDFFLTEGQTVAAGETVGHLRDVRVFAPADGTVAAVHHQTGDEVEDTVLEIAPPSRYTVTCTVSGYAKTPENALVHGGETLWMRCTADGSHRAVGVVTGISGTTFTLEATGGELYIGETVNLYRDSAFAAASLVGRGTVTAHDTLAVAGTGCLTALRVQPGDRVLRGQWLFTLAAGRETALTAPAAGVVTAVSAAEGSALQEDQAAATLGVGRILSLTVDAEEAARFRTGALLSYTRGDDPHETPRPCTVLRLLEHTEDAAVTVELLPEEEDLPLGLSVTVTDDPLE